MHLLLTAFPNQANLNGKNNGFAPLHLAIQEGHVLLVEYILNIDDIDGNIRDPEENTPLIVAAKFGQYRIAACLVQSGKVDVNLQNKYGWTALHVAGFLMPLTWRKAMVTELAKAGNLKLDLEDGEGKRPLADSPDLIEKCRAEKRMKTVLNFCESSLMVHFSQ
jgi:ankyrin repeat protein